MVKEEVDATKCCVLPRPSPRLLSLLVRLRLGGEWTYILTVRTETEERGG